MEKIRIFHNPRCGKSRSACSLLAENGIDAEVVEYLKTPPSKDELATIVKQLGIRPEELIRRNETVFKELYAGKVLSDTEWLEAMVSHPILIERPIVIKGNRAIIGRPPERVLELL